MKRSFLSAGDWLALPVVAALVALCCAPLLTLLAYSFFQVDFVTISHDPTLANYVKIAGSDTYRSLILRAFGSALLVVALTAVIAYPVAWFIAKRVQAAKSTMLTLLLVPLYSGDLIRIFAWRVLLGAEGAINRSLMWLGMINEPLSGLLFSPLATHIALTYNYLPFMVIGLWLSFESLDNSWLEAAADLGAPGTREVFASDPTINRTRTDRRRSHGVRHGHGRLSDTPAFGWSLRHHDHIGD